jgi:hypothetical protein
MALVLAGSAFSAELAEIDTSGAVRTAEEAVERAYQYTGFEEIKSVPQTAEAVTYSDSTTAFLSDSLDGRAAWRVVYPDIQLLPDSLSGKDRPKPVWRAEVWVDSVNGKLLQVYMRNQNADSVPYRMPTVTEAEEQLGVFSEEYRGLPDVQPVVSMLSAIERESGLASNASEIYIQYVIYSRHGEPVPAWVVYFRGTSPTPVHQPAPEAVTRNRRLVVNALSGQAYPVNNLPCPVISE